MHFLAQTQCGQKSPKTQKSEAKNVLLCPVALFSFIFRHNIFTFWPWPFSSAFSHGLAHLHSNCTHWLLCTLSLPSSAQTWKSSRDTLVSLLGFGASRMNLLANTPQWKTITVSCLFHILSGLAWFRVESRPGLKSGGLDSRISWSMPI